MAKLKDVFGRGGYEVHNPGTFKPTAPRDPKQAERKQRGRGLRRRDRHTWNRITRCMLLKRIAEVLP